MTLANGGTVGVAERTAMPTVLDNTLRPRLALLVRGRLVTAHCPAATALQIRVYQSGHHRQILGSQRTHGPPFANNSPGGLDLFFHTRCSKADSKFTW